MVERGRGEKFGARLFPRRGQSRTAVLAVPCRALPQHVRGGLAAGTISRLVRARSVRVKNFQILMVRSVAKPRVSNHEAPNRATSSFETRSFGALLTLRCVEGAT